MHELIRSIRTAPGDLELHLRFAEQVKQSGAVQQAAWIATE
jgi:hypothetical protein